MLCLWNVQKFHFPKTRSPFAACSSPPVNDAAQGPSADPSFARCGTLLCSLCGSSRHKVLQISGRRSFSRRRDSQKGLPQTSTVSSVPSLEFGLNETRRSDLSLCHDRKWHPDRNADNKEAAEKRFKEVSSRYPGYAVPACTHQAEYVNLSSGDATHQMPPKSPYCLNTQASTLDSPYPCPLTLITHSHAIRAQTGKIPVNQLPRAGRRLLRHMKSCQIQRSGSSMISMERKALPAHKEVQVALEAASLAAFLVEANASPCRCCLDHALDPGVP